MVSGPGPLLVLLVTAGGQLTRGGVSRDHLNYGAEVRAQPALPRRGQGVREVDLAPHSWHHSAGDFILYDSMICVHTVYWRLYLCGIIDESMNNIFPNTLTRWQQTETVWCNYILYYLFGLSMNSMAKPLFNAMLIYNITSSIVLYRCD